MLVVVLAGLGEASVDGDAAAELGGHGARVWGRTEGKTGGERAEHVSGWPYPLQGSRGGGGVRRGVALLDTAMWSGGDERLGRYRGRRWSFYRNLPGPFIFHHKQVLFYLFLKPVHWFDLIGAVKHFIKI